MNNDSIISWVNALEGPSPNLHELISDPTTFSLPEKSSPNTARKRKSTTNHYLASPQLDSMATQGKNGNIPYSHFGSKAVVTDTNGLSKYLSRTLSVKRQMMRLRLQEKGVDYHPLNETTVPHVAKMLFLTMMEYGRCHQILPHALRQRIT